MPHITQQHGRRDGGELERGEVDLVRAEVGVQALGRLREAEAGTEVDEQGGGREEAATWYKWAES